MIDNWLWPALTVIAIIAGPFGALLVSRYLDNLRADKARRMDIFRTLMRTRSQPISWEHVQALNLVELEFRNYTNVIDAWKKYLDNLSKPIPPIAEQKKFQQLREKLLTLLIEEIAKTLNVKVQQLEILEGNYVPQGWEDREWEDIVFRRALIQVLQGKSAILVKSQQEQLDTTIAKIYGSSKTNN